MRRRDFQDKSRELHTSASPTTPRTPTEGARLLYIAKSVSGTISDILRWLADGRAVGWKLSHHIEDCGDMRTWAATILSISAVSAINALPRPYSSAAWRAVSPTMVNVVQDISMDGVLIELAQRPPANAHPDAAASLGLFSRTTAIINKKPAYVHATKPNIMLWYMPNGDWCIGLKSELGLSRCYAYCPKNRNTGLPYDIKGKWKFLDNAAGFVENVDVSVSRWSASEAAGNAVGMSQGVGEALTMDPRTMPQMQQPTQQPAREPMPQIQPSPAQAQYADVAADTRFDSARGIDGSVQREARAASRQQAQPQQPPARQPPSQQPATAMEARVANARSMCNAATDAKYRTLMSPLLEAYSADRIDEEELNRRKQEVRAQLEEERWSGLELAVEVAVGDYEVAMAARAAAQAGEAEAVAAANAARAAAQAAETEAAAARAAAQAAEAEAAGRLDAVLIEIERGAIAAPMPGARGPARQPDRASRLRRHAGFEMNSKPNPIVDVVSADAYYLNAGVVIR